MRVFVSYPSGIRARVARLVKQLRNLGLIVIWDNSIPPGTEWLRYLSESIRPRDLILFIATPETEASRWQREEMLAADVVKAKAIPLLVDRDRPPFGMLGLQPIKVTATGQWSNVAARVAAAIRPPAVGQSAHRPESLISPATLLEEHASLEPIGDALKPWLAKMVADPAVWAVTCDVLKGLDEILERTPVSESKVHLRHTARVLRFLYDLSFDGKGRIRDNEPDLVFPSAACYFVAAFAVVLHNLFWLAKLPETTIRSARRLVDRADDCRDRTKIIVRYLVGRSSSGAELIEQASRMSAELFRDAPSWRASAPPVERYLDDGLAALGRQLRRAEACDVSHRFTCDLIRAQFYRFGYRSGLECFLNHTYLPGHDLLLSEPPKLADGTLTVVFRSFPRELPITASVELARDLIREELRLTLDKIDAERRVSSRPSLFVHDEQRPNVGAELIPQLYWAFFVLALVQPASDTRAALLARELLPELVSYISGFDPNLSAVAEHTIRETEALLGCLELLRPGAQSLREVSSESRKALNLVSPKDYAAALRSLRSIYFSDNVTWHDAPVLADVVLCFGVCVAAADLIAQVASRPNEKVRIVRTLSCTRRLLSRRGKNWYGLLPRAEHDEMRKELVVRKRRLKIPYSRLRIKGTIDKASLDAEAANATETMEFCVGARAFTTDSAGRLNGVVTVYGAKQLALTCRHLRIPVRVVSWHSRLTDPNDSVPDRISEVPLQFTYSDHPMPGTENEWVDFNLVTWVTTERGTIAAASLTGKKVEEMKN